MANDTPESVNQGNSVESSPLGEKVQEVTSQLSEQGQEIGRGIQRATQQARETASQYMEQGRARAAEMGEQL